MTVSMGSNMDAKVLSNIIGTTIEGIGSTVIGYNVVVAPVDGTEGIIFKDNAGNTLYLGADVVMIDGVLHRQIIDTPDDSDRKPEDIRRPLLIDRT